MVGWDEGTSWRLERLQESGRRTHFFFHSSPPHILLFSLTHCLFDFIVLCFFRTGHWLNKPHPFGQKKIEIGQHPLFLLRTPKMREILFQRPFFVLRLFIFLLFCVPNEMARGQPTPSSTIRIVLRNPHISARRLARILQLSRATIFRIRQKFNRTSPNEASIDIAWARKKSGLARRTMGMVEMETLRVVIQRNPKASYQGLLRAFLAELQQSVPHSKVLLKGIKMARFVLLVRLIAVRRRMIGKPYLSLRNKQLRMNYVRVFVEVGRIWDLSLRERDSHYFVAGREEIHFCEGSR